MLVLVLYLLFLQYFATLSVTIPSSHKKLESPLKQDPDLSILRDLNKLQQKTCFAYSISLFRKLCIRKGLSAKKEKERLSLKRESVLKSVNAI